MVASMAFCSLVSGVDDVWTARQPRSVACNQMQLTESRALNGPPFDDANLYIIGTSPNVLENSQCPRTPHDCFA
jgi:hypothetical protein